MRKIKLSFLFYIFFIVQVIGSIDLKFVQLDFSSLYAQKINDDLIIQNEKNGRVTIPKNSNLSIVSLANKNISGTFNDFKDGKLFIKMNSGGFDMGSIELSDIKSIYLNSTEIKSFAFYLKESRKLALAASIGGGMMGGYFTWKNMRWYRVGSNLSHLSSGFFHGSIVVGIISYPIVYIYARVGSVNALKEAKEYNLSNGEWTVIK